ncbi:hypothetical protein EUX98_g9690 [Antrodiella citrinella]|uniref:Uncharacterized protein n=1 Tax=Antrodiella citrinella TaxID=2447956 RepID=A0A4S4LQA7_9APHY|nr:hypothetical protein EUX98_g9690 [Antrodiella citrinella]
MDCRFVAQLWRESKRGHTINGHAAKQDLTWPDEEEDTYDPDLYGPPPEAVHQRIFPLRALVSSGIPCILWGEDAEAFQHGVTVRLFDLNILVPDHLVDAAAKVPVIQTQCPQYQPTTEIGVEYDYYGDGPLKATMQSLFPKAIHLRHALVGDNKLYWQYLDDENPHHIILLPQSYFGLDVASPEDFLPLDLPLYDTLNAGIVVPKYHTFLEGLVEWIMLPPTDLTPATKCERMLDELIDVHLEPRLEDDDPDPNGFRGKKPGVPLTIETEILGELQTKRAIWWFSSLFHNSKPVRMEEIVEYKRQERLHESHRSVRTSTVSNL